jgi:hypothetical protein
MVYDATPSATTAVVTPTGLDDSTFEGKMAKYFCHIINMACLLGVEELTLMDKLTESN